MNTYDCNKRAEVTEVPRSHYGLMLRLQRPWRLETVKLDVMGNRLELGLECEREGASQDCPECGRACHLHHHAPERQRRHLDAVGFVTTLRARVPRIECPEHGVKSEAIPWALPHGRFTLAFEAMVIEVVKACASVHAACGLLKLEWKRVHAIMERAAQRGMRCRRVDGLKSVGFDEKSLKRGQSFISHMCDLRHPRVLEVVQGRDPQSARALWQSLPEEISARVEDAVMDMSAGFASAARMEAPQALVTYNKADILIKKWFSRVKKTGLRALKKFAAMVERHLNGLLNHVVSCLTNALCEGFNSKILQIKTAARSFRSFQNYRTRILFFLGDLDLSVRLSH
jgi:transposase